MKWYFYSVRVHQLSRLEVYKSKNASRVLRKILKEKQLARVQQTRAKVFHLSAMSCLMSPSSSSCRCSSVSPSVMYISAELQSTQSRRIQSIRAGLGQLSVIEYCREKVITKHIYNHPVIYFYLI